MLTKHFRVLGILLNLCSSSDLWGVKMASPMATRRLRQDYMRLMRDPVPYVEAAPLPSNILEW